MNIEATPATSCVKAEGPEFTETVPCSSGNVQQLNLQHVDTTDADALEAVKQDPAVLEAQVTVDSSPRPSATQLVTYVGRQDQASIDKPESSLASFERAVMQSKAALLSLTPAQYQLLLRYAATLRRQRRANQMRMECAFCKNNGEPIAWYSSHALRSWRGRVCCPVLRAYHCPRCGATGDRAHTIKYCPENAEDLLTCYLNPRSCFYE